MARTVIISVHETPTGPPAEIGRAWVGNDGAAVVRGFMDKVRTQYETVGILWLDATHDEMVPLSDGDRFLDVLVTDYGRASRMHVEEVDE
jgi:hypothetical protein